MGDHLPFILYCYIFTILIPGQEHSFYTRNTYVYVSAYTYVLVASHVRRRKFTFTPVNGHTYVRIVFF